MHTLIKQTCEKQRVSSENVIRNAYRYAEKPKSPKAILRVLIWCNELSSHITEELEDYCLAVLSGRVIPL
jgi:hypothetical protein